MSDIRIKTHTLTIGGESFAVYFSLATLDAILERYGALDEMLRKMGIPDEKTIAKLKKGEIPEQVDQKELVRAICFFVAALINDSLEDRGEDRRVDERWVMRRLLPEDLSILQNDLLAVMMDGMPKAQIGKGNSKNV